MFRRIAVAAVMAAALVSQFVLASPPDGAGERWAAPMSRELRVVPRVDLERYMGRWYEIARYPNSYQNGLVGVIAEYTLRSDGKFDVANSGRRGTLDGELRASRAVGWVACKSTTAKLYVQFVWPFKADYWIIDLCPDYSYAVVGQPDRSNLWVLCRAPQMDDAVFDQICRRLIEQGYDPRKLVRTPQPKPAN